MQRQAEQKQAALLIQNLERRIGADVVLALSVLTNSILGMSSSEAALLSYREALSSERKKLRAGLSTLFDVVLMESRLNGAEQTALRASARVAVALIQLRYQTGTLLDPSGPLVTLSTEHLTTLPPLLKAASGASM